jgi:hypothetical protein
MLRGAADWRGKSSGSTSLGELPLSLVPTFE